MTLTVTWKDGKQETYTCPGYEIRGYVLYLEPDPGRAPRQMIPLGNVRFVTE